MHAMEQIMMSDEGEDKMYHAQILHGLSAVLNAIEQSLMEFHHYEKLHSIFLLEFLCPWHWQPFMAEL